MEGAPKHEAADNIESWSELKAQAPEMALEKLAERELMNDIELATPAEIESLVATLPSLIEELTHNEEGGILNENRYVARELSVLLNKAKMKLAYEQAPSPLASAA